MTYVTCNMQAYVIETFTHFYEIIDRYNARTVIYRGVKSEEYPLIPKIGRVTPPESAGSREQNELEILHLFKERAFQYLDFTPATGRDWLALGQQYGLPTRLLDWTENPLVACFFTVDQEHENNAVIYAYGMSPILTWGGTWIRSNTKKIEASSRAVGMNTIAYEIA